MTYKDALDWLEGIVRERGHPITPDQVVRFINEPFYESQKYELDRRGIAEYAEAIRALGRIAAFNVAKAERERQRVIQELGEAKQLKATIFVRNGVRYSQNRDAKGRFVGKMTRL